MILVDWCNVYRIATNSIRSSTSASQTSPRDTANTLWSPRGVRKLFRCTLWWRWTSTTEFSSTAGTKYVNQQSIRWVRIYYRIKCCVSQWGAPNATSQLSHLNNTIQCNFFYSSKKIKCYDELIIEIHLLQVIIFCLHAYTRLRSLGCWVSKMQK